MVEAVELDSLRSVWWNSDGLIDAPPSKFPRIHIYEGLYRGSGQDLSILESMLPQLEEQFPKHTIYADGREIIGALAKDLTPETPIYRDILRELTGKLEDREISFFHCAIITTGGPDRVVSESI